MRKKQNKFILILLNTLLAIGSLSSSISAENNAATFTHTPLDARPAALGMAGSTLIKNSAAIVWNPANLATLQSADLSLVKNTAYEASNTAIFFAMPHKNKKSPSTKNTFTWGIGTLHTTIDGIKESNRNNNRAQETGNSLSYTGTAIWLSIAKAITPKLHLGSSAKYIEETQAGYKGNGLGLDTGLRFEATPHLHFGYSTQNLIRPKLSWDTVAKTEEKAPQIHRLGMVYNTKNFPMSLAIDIKKQESQNETLHLGLEYLPTPYLAIRSGLDNTILTLGCGLIMQKVRLDIAWQSPNKDAVDDIYKFTLGYRF